jgi:hemerythrin
MRKLVEWTEELSVGVQEIDEQHKVLVGLLNRFHEAVVTGTDEQNIKNVLKDLADYTIIHFSVEESLMRIFNYPDYDNHKKHHEELTAQVRELQRKVEEGNHQVSMEVLNFLRHWLTHHILGDDKKYGPYLVERGVESNWAKRSWVGRIWGSLHS